MTDSQASSKTIVIVDHDSRIRQLFADALGPQGYIIAEAASSEEFFRSTSGTNSSTDIFIDDAVLFFISLDLKDNQGLKIIEWLQGCERWADVPITVLASKDNFSQVLPASYFGAHGYLVKEFGAKTLTRHVDKTLSQCQPTFGSGLPTLTFSLPDYIAKEISQAKRTHTPVSLMMGSFVGYGTGLSDASDSIVESDLPWVDEALEISRRAIRECDTVIRVGMFTFMAVLPLTTKAGLDVIEARLHDHLKALLQAVKTTTDQEFALVTAGSCAPDEAEDWRTFVDLARIRLRIAIENRAAPVEHAA
ncbi:MAG: response regulator [Armatimonadota bacterium]